jgi:hypothetical protein
VIRGAAETTPSSRADMACHWEDSDAVVREILVTVSVIFSPSGWLTNATTGFIDMYLYRICRADCIGYTVHNIRNHLKRGVNSAIPTNVNLLFPGYPCFGNGVSRPPVRPRALSWTWLLPGQCLNQFPNDPKSPPCMKLLDGGLSGLCSWPCCPRFADSSRPAQLLENYE